MEKGCNLSVVIDGSSFAIGIENFKDLLAFVMVYAVSVIFCRMAPLQKSQVHGRLSDTRLNW
jgi:magnesium-transporting ATPase (P-type)